MEEQANTNEGGKKKKKKKQGSDLSRVCSHLFAVPEDCQHGVEEKSNRLARWCVKTSGKDRVKCISECASGSIGLI